MPDPLKRESAYLVQDAINALVDKGAARLALDVARALNAERLGWRWNLAVWVVTETDVSKGDYYFHGPAMIAAHMREGK